MKRTIQIICFDELELEMFRKLECAGGSLYTRQSEGGNIKMWWQMFLHPRNLMEYLRVMRLIHSSHMTFVK